MVVVAKKSTHKYNKKAKMWGQGTGRGRGMEWAIEGIWHLYNSVLGCIMMGIVVVAKKASINTTKIRKWGARDREG
jgi:hypothetical protein